MKQIMRDLSGLLPACYTSAKVLQDGKFHEIKVNVKRRGGQRRARKGYWALTKGRCRTRDGTAETQRPRLSPRRLGISPHRRGDTPRDSDRARHAGRMASRR